ncbi:MAG: hypothetical protein ACI4NN_04055 [Pyramidobacter sp.]|jgi:hypothetical protein
MYVNEGKTARKAVAGKIQAGFGWFLAITTLLGTILLMFDKNKDLTLGSYIVYGLMILFGLWLVWLSMKKKKLRIMLTQLDQFFMADADGIVSMKETADCLGKNISETKSLISKLIGEKYLQNCTIKGPAQDTIVLFGARPSQDSAVFEMRTCPGCGAASSQRVGYEGVCPYCGRHF